MKKCHVVSTAPGCATHLLETAAWREHFESQGHVSCATPENADVIVVNTCAYSAPVEAATTRLVTDLKERYGETKKILVTGCMQGINPVKLGTASGGERLEPPEKPLDFFARHHRFHPEDFAALTFKHKAVLFLRSWYYSAERLAGRQFQPLHNVLKTVMVNEQFHLLTAAAGCLGACTFCAIKNAKGRVESRSLQALVQEFDEGLAAGARDFWLLGDDLGCWGQDLGASLPELLSALLSRSGDFTLAVNYLDPTFLLRYADELLPLFSDPRVILVNVPVQAASPGLLKRMGRAKDIDGVLRWVAQVKRNNPGLVVKTNFMVGFPGQTWGDLLASWKAIFSFDAAVVLAYSPRPNTPAAEFPEQHGELSKKVQAALTNVVIQARHLQVAAGSLLRR